jgi:hypothetical protein
MQASGFHPPPGEDCGYRISLRWPRKREPTCATVQGRADLLTRFSLSLIALYRTVGCGELRLDPEPVRDAVVVGVVDGWESIGPRTDPFQLSDGRKLEIDYNEARQLSLAMPSMPETCCSMAQMTGDCGSR